MAKKQKTSLFIAVGVVAILILAMFMNTGSLFSATTLTENIFCYEPEYFCCVDTKADVVKTIPDPRYEFFTCDYKQCTIKSFTRLSGCTIHKSPSSSTCDRASFFGIIEGAWTCDKQSPLIEGDVLTKGDKVWAGCVAEYSLSYTSSTEVLFDTGKSGSTTGTVVQTDGCVFNLDSDLYNQNGQIVKTPTQVSYTVPSGTCGVSFLEANKRVCGSKLDECETDADCVDECSARYVREKKCVAGEQICTKKDSTGKCVEYQTSGKKCQAISAVKVQCCGDADCGSGAVCDKTSHVCKAPDQVQCVNDWDCGITTQCDPTTTTLKKPDCVAGKCAFQTTQDVQCCAPNIGCQQGFFCSSDYTCKQQSTYMTSCPYECCPAERSDDRSKFFDKPCGEGYFCNEAHSCRPITSGTTGSSGSFSWGIFIFSALVGLIIGGVVFWYSTPMSLMRTGNNNLDKAIAIVRWVLVIGVTILVTVLVASLIKGVIGVFSI